MVKSIGIKEINTAVFISGTGTNLRSLLNFFSKKKSRIKIRLILSNNPKAKGLRYAKTFKIKKETINYKNQKLAENKVLHCLNNNKIDQ